jgi:hypothetical protein
MLHGQSQPGVTWTTISSIQRSKDLSCIQFLGRWMSQGCGSGSWELLAVHRSPFTVHRSPFTAGRSAPLDATRHSPLAAHVLVPFSVYSFELDGALRIAMRCVASVKDCVRQEFPLQVDGHLRCRPDKPVINPLRSIVTLASLKYYPELCYLESESTHIVGHVLSALSDDGETGLDPAIVSASGAGAGST